MTEYWWKDLFDRNNNWQGLEFTIRAHQGVAQAMDMLSGHHGRMALQLHGETLFWASMLKIIQVSGWCLTLIILDGRV